MRVAVLGPLAVDLATGPISPRGQRLRDVLTVLVQRRGHVVAPDVVLDLVWGEQALGLAAGAVHTVIARLRRHLGPGLVETHDAGYRLGREVTVDVDAFEAAVRRARAAAGAGHPEAAIAAYRDALALWRGPAAFEGASEDLVTGDRARLDEARAQVLEELAAALLAGGAPAQVEEALTVAVELTREHPLREGPHRTAMLAAARLGRQAEALALFRDLRARLRAELGIEPSAATAAVHQRVLTQDPTLGPPPAAPPLEPQAAAQPDQPDRLAQPDQPAQPDQRQRESAVGRRGSARLPVPLTPTVGRETELDAVTALLAEGRRLVTILGPGGVGKSRLLAQVGARLSTDRDRSAPEVGYTDLSGLGECGPDEIAEAVAAGIGLRIDCEDPVASLVETLADAPVIALLDEAEWAVAAVAEVATRVLAACPGVRLVVTSRIPLDVLGESRVPLAPLACPAPDATGPAARAAPAVRLLEARLRDHAPDLLIDDDDGACLAQIARRVDGLPLALELVAGSAGSRTLTELLSLVEAPLDVAGHEHGLRPRHRTLRDTLVWSVARLGDTERVVLRRLGVFAGSFEVSTARAVAGDSLPPAAVESALRALVRDALVQRDGRGRRTRLRLLRTVRDLAVEQLTAHGELDRTRRRHRQWYAARWRGQPPQDELVVEVADSYDDYIEALRRALDARDAASVAALAITLGHRWHFDEAAGVGIRWLDRVLASGLLDDLDTPRVRVLRWALALTSGRAVPPAELDRLQQALAGDPPWLALALIVSAAQHYAHGELELSTRAAARLVEVTRAHVPSLLADGLGTKAAVLAAAGDAPGAIAAADEAWALAQAEPSALLLSWVGSKVGIALTDAGRHADALRVLTETIDVIGNRLGSAPTRPPLINAGWAALGTGDPAAALTWFTRALDTSVGLPPGVFAAEECSGAACSLALLGTGDGERLLDMADELCRRRGLVLTPTQQQYQTAARARAGVGQPDSVAALTDSALAGTIHAAARTRATG